jgi:hypothetical protein
MDNLLRQIPNIGNYKSSQLISEGISNQNYKIILENNSTATLLATLFPNENIWWKADKEKFITNFYSKNNIPSATVLNTGYITHNQLKYRYLLREFVQEKDFSALLMDNKTLLPNDWISLLTDLGDILGILHKIHLDSYGLVRDGSIPESNIQLINPVNSWSDYMDKVERFLEKTYRIYL